MLRGIRIERLARKVLHQRPEHNEIDVAINKRRTRRAVGRDFKRHAIRRVLALPLLPQFEIFGEP